MSVLLEITFLQNPISDSNLHLTAQAKVVGVKEVLEGCRVVEWVIKAVVKEHLQSERDVRL
jgi:hypothetical protein